MVSMGESLRQLCAIFFNLSSVHVIMCIHTILPLPHPVCVWGGVGQRSVSLE